MSGISWRGICISDGLWESIQWITVGKVDIELKEPEWKPEENKKIEPSKVIHKDPQITNTGTNDAFVYMEVSIPMANVEAAAENGERLGKKVQELFSFEAKPFPHYPLWPKET